jgi:hypothetical protein
MTDYIYVKPAPPAILLAPGHAMGFKYGYIYPFEQNMKTVYEQFLKDNKLTGKPFNLPQTGNAPSVINVVVGPGIYCPPRHPTYFEPRHVELNGIP